jgi:hypothetical protein
VFDAIRGNKLRRDLQLTVIPMVSLSVLYNFKGSSRPNIEKKP